MTESIALWGAGKFGQHILGCLRESEFGVTCFIDTNSEMEGREVCGVKVISPEELLSSLNISLLLITFIDGISIYKQLMRYDNIKIGIVRNSVLKYKRKIDLNDSSSSDILWLDNINKPLMMMLETNIVDSCNLNCKGCSHFSNLFKAGDRIPFDTYRRDLKQIADNVFVFKYNMLGGEVLLHEDICDYIRFSRETLPFTEIRLITNGLLLLKMKDSFFDCCIKNGVGIEISEYRPTTAVIDKIEKRLNEFGIDYEIRKQKEAFGKNIDLRGLSDKQKAMSRCRESQCHFFRNGYIYKCPFEVLGNRLFEHFNLDIKLDGGIDIFSVSDWAEVVRKLEEDTVDACRYCGKEERYEWDVSANPQIEDWIINADD